MVIAVPLPTGSLKEEQRLKRCHGLQHRRWAPGRPSIPGRSPGAGQTRPLVVEATPAAKDPGGPFCRHQIQAFGILKDPEADAAALAQAQRRRDRAGI